jgi:hypothetical protein
MGQSLGLIVTGTALGLILALLATRLFSNLLFGAGADDPATFSITILVLVLIALSVTLVRARNPKTRRPANTRWAS